MRAGPLQLLTPYGAPAACRMYSRGQEKCGVLRSIALVKSWLPPGLAGCHSSPCIFCGSPLVMQ